MIALLEILFTLVCAALEAFAFVSFSKRVRKTTEINTIVIWLVSLAGVVIGGLSVWLYPHPLLQDAKLRMASVFVAPICVALVVLLIGQFYGEHQRIASLFLGACLGTVGITLVRFLFA